ncbi:unnamed protein product [Rotaria sp. Silwood1]|nr:unnamed protein product [Rotaria sp. Silwood1]CAF4828431.1 unnamed protein product [Rotaria sp. Silwood1]
MTTFISHDNQLETSKQHQYKCRKKINEIHELDRTFHKKNRNMLIDDHNIDQALLSLDTCIDSKQENILNRNTVRSISDTYTSVTKNLNDSTKQLSLFCESSTNVETIKSNIEVIDDENHISKKDEKVNYEIHVKQSTDPCQNISIIKNTSQRKRHIMISYDRSSIKTCRKIYHRLVEKNYKVWIDLEHMFDDILVAMAQAIENSYIILLCINQQYYESDYCRLEAVYAAENRIKFIPCLMEKSFHPQSWLGSNFHIDFSSSDDFDQSFKQLIRQITYIEKELSLEPRRTPAPNSIIINPMIAASISTSTITDNINSYRFDSIIYEYKRKINKTKYHLNELNRNELSELIGKIRQELFNEKTKILLNNEQSNDEDYKKFLQLFVDETLKQNELLLKLIDDLTKQQSIEQYRRHNFNMNRILKVILGIMFLWILVLFCEK